MRFEFDYEMGEEHKESFEVYFPEYDLLQDMPIECLEKLSRGNKIYKVSKKTSEPLDVLNNCLSTFKFKVVENDGMKLDKPIIFFDLETTGVDLVKDQIVQIAATKVFTNGSRDSKVRYIKPTIKIPVEVTEIHGIDADTVKNAPSFREVAKSLRSFFDGCDIGGFNSTKFDVPLLQEEFLKAGITDWPAPGTRFVDAMAIYHKHNPRTLVAAYDQYCGKDLEGAHDAGADITATMEVLEAQIEQHEEVPNTIQELHDYCNEGRVDFAGTLRRDEEGVVRYAIGKAKGDAVLDNPGFGEWMLKQTFTSNTKACVREILDAYKVGKTTDECK